MGANLEDMPGPAALHDRVSRRERFDSKVTSSSIFSCITELIGGYTAAGAPPFGKGVADLHQTLKDMMKGVAGASDVVEGLGAAYTQQDKRSVALSSAERSSGLPAGDEGARGAKVMKRCLHFDVCRQRRMRTGSRMAQSMRNPSWSRSERAFLLRCKGVLAQLTCVSLP